LPRSALRLDVGSDVESLQEFVIRPNYCLSSKNAIERKKCVRETDVLSVVQTRESAQSEKSTKGRERAHRFRISPRAPFADKFSTQSGAQLVQKQECHLSSTWLRSEQC
jgi:hypothetical protein